MMEMVQTFKTVYVSCQRLILPNIAAALSMSYLHKYQKVVGTALDDAAEDMNILYIAAIFLGCKTTENLRSMRDIYNIVTKTMDDTISLSDLDKMYVANKEKIIAKEHELLRVLSFDVELDLPHKYLLNIARHLNIIQGQVRIAWSFLNDAFLSSKCAESKPEVVAAACLLLALEVSMQELKKSSEENAKNGVDGEKDDHLVRATPTLATRWWNGFGIEDSDILHAAGWICQICIEHSST